MPAETLDTTNLRDQSSLKTLIDGCESYRHLVATASDADSLIQLIISEFVAGIRDYIAIGDLEFDRVKENQHQHHLSISYLLHYRLAEQFKSLSLLHRDVLLQLNIARCRQFENQLTPEIVAKHFQESKNVLTEAVESFISFCGNELSALTDTTSKSKRWMTEMGHQKNPWDVYREQLQLILDQLTKIDESGNSVIDAVTSFRQLRNYISSLIEKVHENLKNAKKLIEESIQNLESIKETKDLGQKIVWIDKILDDRLTNKDQQNNFVIQVENLTRSLEAMDIPVATDSGILQERKIELNKVTNKWLEYELLPLLIEVWDSEVSLESFLDHSLINLKSGLMLANNNLTIDSIASQIEFLQNIGVTVDENIHKQHEATGKIDQLVNNTLIATNVYHEEDFLEVSLQSSFAQYTTVKNTLFNRLKNKLNNLFVDLGSKYEEANLQSNQKRLETSLECIRYRMFKESNTSYDSLFRNKIFIGDLFLVNREEEEATFAQSLDQWKAGFNQSALIVGKHLSGKSTFTEYIAKQNFGRHVIKLEVTGSITVEGRKLKTNYNLGETLKFIKNNLYHSKPLIIIDDIETWRNEEHSLLDNVRAVIKYIEAESDNVYVMVTTSKAMQDHLDSRLSFTNSFSSVINIDKSTSEEIYQAVLLRHGASHKDLIAPDQQKLSPKQMQVKVKELCRLLNYNIGKVLQVWTYSSTVVDDKLVLFEDKDYPFRDFFTVEEIIVLKFVVLYKHINEVALKGFLGPRNDVYLSGLKRLVNTKVLIRNEDGELELNTVIYHDVVDILKYRGIL